MGEVRMDIIIEKSLPPEEPLGIQKYRWSTWYMMRDVHQARRKMKFSKELDPLEGHRFY